MRRRSTIDPTVAADLDLLDSVLAGDAEDPQLALIAGEARAGAARMTPAFVARLEQAVTDGFSAAEDAGAGTGRSAPASLRSRVLRALPARPHPRLVPALGVAFAAAAALVVGVSALGGSDNGALTSIGRPSAAGGVAATEAKGSGSAVAPESAVAPTESALQVPAPAPRPGQDAALAVPPPGAGPRRIQRTAFLTITTPIAQLQDTSDAVTAQVDRVGGFVARSDVSAEGDAGNASFDLRIPVGRLDETIAALSRLGHVRSRSDQTQDITAQFSTTLSRLHDARAERQALLRSLAKARTPQAIESLRAQLATARSRIAAAKGDLAAVRRASNVASVGLVLEGVSGDQGGAGGSWTPRRALHDAASLLSVAAGVAIVALAAALPAALLLMLLALAWRVHRHRRRELALDAPPVAV